ncbi:MAG: chemotaxis protein CheA [Clostridiales bacterium]|nr:chemotaxis protein CheA [Clostridiales bacterium]
MSKFDPGMETMLDMYIFETNTLLEQLDEILLRTEQNNQFDDEDINEIFRIMHTIKGSSAMMGLDGLSGLAHIIEDMFYIIRENKNISTNIEHLYDLVFKSSDYFKAEMDRILSPDYDESDCSTLKGEIEEYIVQLKGGSVSDKPVHKNADKEKGYQDMGMTTVKVLFDEECKMENLRAFLLVNNIRHECEHIEYEPSDIETNADSAKEIIENGFMLHFIPTNSKEEIFKLIEETVNVESYEEIHSSHDGEQAKVDSGADTESRPAEIDKINNAITNSRAGKQSLISVNLTKLDELHDVVGEIIITESMVTSNPDLRGLDIENFDKAARQLRKLTDTLQDIVMSIRMVPLSGVFQKMNRIVRDMKIKLDKDVDLIIEGGETEVDKSIIDNLNDPLMHLIRNCMDHGIETSEERARTDKDATGKITLSARNASGEVIIVIADDGKGIDVNKVLEKAKKNNMLTKPAEEYTDKELLNLILEPGFSMKDKVTEFSGRGVGMDVVRQNIEKLGGSVNVESTLGEGTSFIVKIPLTLAIIDGMEVAVGESIFTVPISTIRESFKVKSDQIINDTGQGEMIMIRGECYPILRLYNKFNIDTQIKDLEKGILMLVETDDRAICLFVDRLIGEQQVVVKPFPSYLNKFDVKKQGISGCTIMGDGNISLIIDVINLIGTL